ncbi:MAG: helix-turn-helix domain-containing protein [Verrucomicrobiota bacterium]|nr:helix-turn-helix domain-containing protein [Verrucomicrobiota bacterium]
MQLLRWNDIADTNEVFHLVRVSWGRNHLPRTHVHDFYEIFWIDSGVCLHCVNQNKVALQAGDIVFIRPSDAHQLLPNGSGGFSFTNLAFPQAFMQQFITRFPEEMAAFYPSENPLPVTKALRHYCDELALAVTTLAESPHTKFYLERFLLNLMNSLIVRQLNLPHPSIPEWLSDACFKVREPEIFCGGVAAFVQTTGRSAEHCARTTRHYFGKSPSELVTEARMEFAARALRLTTKSVLEIGMDCGYKNPARFFVCFKAYSGMTPLKYRQTQLSALGLAD